MKQQKDKELCLALEAAGIAYEYRDVRDILDSDESIMAAIVSYDETLVISGWDERGYTTEDVDGDCIQDIQEENYLYRASLEDTIASLKHLCGPKK